MAHLEKRVTSTAFKVLLWLEIAWGIFTAFGSWWLAALTVIGQHGEGGLAPLYVFISGWLVTNFIPIGILIWLGTMHSEQSRKRQTGEIVLMLTIFIAGILAIGWKAGWLDYWLD